MIDDMDTAHPAARPPLSVYGTSDLHAHWDVPGGGIGRALALLADRDDASAILVDNGDTLTGSALGAALAAESWADGHPVLRALEHSGFDVAVPGNHDLDHGVDRLREAVSRLTSLRYVCANMVSAATGEPVFDPACVIDRAGLSVAVIGALTGHLQRLSRYEAVRGIRVTDPVAAVAREVERLRGAADVIVVAYHGGFTSDPVSGAPWHYDTGEDQAARLLRIPGVDGVLAGHQHVVRSGVVAGAAGPVAYAQPGYAGSHVARLEFAADGTAADATALPTADAEPDPAHPLAARASAAQDWLDTRAPLTDDAVHAVVAERAGVAETRLALPPEPRTWGELAAAFPGVYGASVLRLPDAEAAPLPGESRAQANPVGQRAERDTLVVANAPVVEAAPAGRVEEDLVVNWLDEFVWASRPSRHRD